MCALFLSIVATPSSVVTDPPQLLLTAVATSVLLVYSILENKSWGSPIAVVANFIVVGSKSPQEYKMLIYTTASQLSVLWQTLMVQPLILCCESKLVIVLLTLFQVSLVP